MHSQSEATRKLEEIRRGHKTYHHFPPAPGPGKHRKVIQRRYLLIDKSRNLRKLSQPSHICQSQVLKQLHSSPSAHRLLLPLE
jgi:hypothetical protein